MKYTLNAPRNNNLSIVEQIFKNRGIEDVFGYLRTTNKDLIDPWTFTNMEEGVDLLIKHLNEGNNIYLQVDSDADGYTSSALFLNAIYRLDANYLKHIFYGLHPGKEHGINMQRALDCQPKLVVAIDASSNELEKHAELKKQGIDVLVIDHHEADVITQDAILINPAVDPMYPNKALAGVGVCYKFVQCLYQTLEVKDTHATDFLDLLAVGTVADMIDLRPKETKHLVQAGMQNIMNPLISALVEKQSFSLKGALTPTGIGFYIAPLVNAVIRVGTEQEKAKLFAAMLEINATKTLPSTKRGKKPGEVETLVAQVVRESGNIKNRQGREVDKGIELVENFIKEHNLGKHQILVVNTHHLINKNLTGLIANKILSKYQKPTLLVSENSEGVLTGSGRGYDKSSLTDFREFLNHSTLVNYAEGHGNAFGVGVHKDKLDDLLSYSNTELADLDFTPTYKVDFVWDAAELSSRTIEEIGVLQSYWGKFVEEPLFVVKGVTIRKDGLEVMGTFDKPTIKFTYGGITFLKFRCDPEIVTELRKNQAVTIDLVGKANINDYNGVLSGQIYIEDMVINQTQKWYF